MCAANQASPAQAANRVAAAAAYWVPAAAQQERVARADRQTRDTPAFESSDSNDSTQPRRTIRHGRQASAAVNTTIRRAAVVTIP